MKPLSGAAPAARWVWTNCIMYDLYVPMVDEVDFDMPFDKRLRNRWSSEALKPLGEEYGKLLDRAFAERWIDVYENKGKTTGAYSMRRVRRASLRAAELHQHAGRRVHAGARAGPFHAFLFIRTPTQDYVNHDYSIFVAEVASTVNEVLLTKYLLKVETDPKPPGVHPEPLPRGLPHDGIPPDAVRRVRAHAPTSCSSPAAPLTAQTLNAVYRALNETYYPGAVLDALHRRGMGARSRTSTARFYVYQYATGFCSAVTIADRILNVPGARGGIPAASSPPAAAPIPIDELRDRRRGSRRSPERGRPPRMTRVRRDRGRAWPALM